MFTKISEGSKYRYFGAKRLRVKTSDGGNVLLVPENEVELDTIQITENGSYAPENGLYAFSNVYVNVNGSDFVRGKNGVVTLNNGRLEYNELPNELRIVEPPNKTNYNQGEPVDYTGMIVKAYYDDGTLWTDEKHPDGVIPIDELTINEYGAMAEQRSATITFDENITQSHVVEKHFTVFAINDLSYWIYADDNNNYDACITDGKAVIILGGIIVTSGGVTKTGIAPYIYRCNSKNKIKTSYKGCSSFSGKKSGVKTQILSYNFLPISTDVEENPQRVYYETRQSIDYYREDYSRVMPPTRYKDFKKNRNNEKYVEWLRQDYEVINISRDPKTGRVSFFDSLLSGYASGLDDRYDLEGYNGLVNELHPGNGNWDAAPLWVAVYGHLDKTVYAFTVGWNRPKDGYMLTAGLDINYT